MTTGDAFKAQLEQKIRAIWKENRGLTDERVQTLVEAAQVLRAGSLTPELRTKAESEAHKIAGSAGSFGFDEISRVARELELLFADSDSELSAELVSARVRQLQELVGRS